MNSTHKLNWRPRKAVQRVFCTLLLALMVVAGTATLVLASDVDDALWRGTVTVSNNGTTASAVSVNMSLSSASLVSQGYASADLTDIAMQVNGVDTAFMPSVNASYPWAIFVPNIGASQNLNYDLYTRGATGGKIAYFPGEGGMTADSFQIGDNFTVEQGGWCDTTAVGANLTSKLNAIRSYISGSGNITSTIYPFVGYTSPTGFTDDAGAWSNETNAYDDNIATETTDAGINDGDWTEYLRLSHAGLTITGIRFYENDADVDQINLDYYDGSWHDLYEGVTTNGAWNYQYLDIPAVEVTECRFKLHNNSGGLATLGLHELDFIETEPVSVTASSVSSGNHTVITSLTENLLANGSFETGDPPTGWGLSGCTLAQENAIIKIGDFSLKIHTPTADYKYAKQEFSTTAYQGKTVTLGALAYAPSTNVRDQRLYLADNLGINISDIIPKDDAWHWVTVTRTMDAAATDIRTRFYISYGVFNAGDVLYVDGAVLIVQDDIADYGNFVLSIDGTEIGVWTDNSTYCYVPDNDNDWSYVTNGAMSYMDYTSISVNGTPQQYITWQYNDTVFTDPINGHDATPTFRTASSDPDVSAELTSFEPMDEAKLDTFSLASSTEILTANATLPSEMYNELDVSRIPGGEAVNEMLAEGGVPQAAWWFPFLYLGICVAGLTMYGATTLGRTGMGGRLAEGQIDGSLLVMFIAMEVPLALLGIMGVTPFWPAILFPIAGIALILSRKHYSWG